MKNFIEVTEVEAREIPPQSGKRELIYTSILINISAITSIIVYDATTKLSLKGCLIEVLDRTPIFVKESYDEIKQLISQSTSD